MHNELVKLHSVKSGALVSHGITSLASVRLPAWMSTL